jgi:hypothetical protein
LLQGRCEDLPDKLLVLLAESCPAVVAGDDQDDIAVGEFVGEGGLEELPAAAAGSIFGQEGGVPALGELVPRRRQPPGRPEEEDPGPEQEGQYRATAFPKN